MKDPRHIEHQEILPPVKVRKIISLSHDNEEFIKESRKSIENILNEKDPRKLIIIGPCSIHHLTSATTFGLQIKKWQAMCPEYFFIMRAHLEKPRSSHDWQGFVYDPYLDGSNKIQEGILLSRQLLKILCDLRIPVTAEILDPFLFPYLSDLYSMGNIGSRTILSPTHRKLGSIADFPIGLKNPLDGEISDVVNAMNVLSKNTSSLSINEKGKVCSLITKGNPHSFTILRGTKNGPNNDLASIDRAAKILRKNQKKTKIVLDCAHGNSHKLIQSQIDNISYGFDLLNADHPNIIGLMVEAHMKEGKNESSEKIDMDQSITDPCISAETFTELLIEKTCPYSSSIKLNHI